jgi:type I restriction-modification system DNA methylase subunit
MPLFQQSVQKKFIKDLDKAKVEAAYQKLIAHFGNIDVQENIRKAKEEQYQEGFLRELFVDVLGYVLNPQPNFNLITEQKNEKNSKKADGAILKNNKPVAVIELKSVKTTDLQSIEIQAFNYKNNQTECIYVVTSNFQKLRFYIENAVDFEEFDLFDISKEQFDLLYLCLQVDNVLSDLPLRIKQASLEREENITKKLYADYSLFKQTLFKDITNHNKEIDKLTLFKKTQKLLDRFLFVFFAEDKGLLPPNSVALILEDWDKLKELDEYKPLYSRFKKYFGYLNSGHVGKKYTIFAYNGGLFAPDDLLDNLTITDGVLYQYCRILSHYDFDTEVDTNILGHIFEHSLNEVDEVAANTEGVSLDKGKTKRKKDGIFYTPRYITKYIVESTIGELCKQKKLALGLDNEALIKADTKKDRKLYQVKIDEYRKWLLQLTILDPACGSGAFLNQALEFLIQEHRLIDTMTAMLFGDSLIMTDNVTEILENNIFGVDINEESVEIARLALWLRTAKVGRKLNDLSRNIKCGNSLISDLSVAGDLAFDWQKAFPQVFAKGGFDVVIGNPPYVLCQPSNTDEVTLNYYKSYEVASYKIDLFHLFFEKGVNILSRNGQLGFITPNTYLTNKYIQKLRLFILENTLGCSSILM